MNRSSIRYVQWGIKNADFLPRDGGIAMKNRWMTLAALTLAFTMSLTMPGASGNRLAVFGQSPAASSPVVGVHAWDTALSTNRDPMPEAVPARLSQAVAFLAGSPLAWAGNRITLMDLNQTDLAPFIEDGIYMAPVRFLTESLGGRVTWNPVTARTELSLGSVTVRLKAGASAFDVNGLSGSFGKAATLRGGRLFAPAKALIAALGMQSFQSGDLLVASQWPQILSEGTNASALTTLTASLTSVRRVASEAELSQLMSGWQSSAYLRGGVDSPMLNGTEATGAQESGSQDAAPPPMAAEKSGASDSAIPSGTAGAASDSDAASHSETNVQVAGVDEGDVVKTDGRHLYIMREGEILIVRTESTAAAGSLSLVSRIPLSDASLQPTELYIDNGRLVVVGQTWLQPEGPWMPMVRDSAVDGSGLSDTTGAATDSGILSKDSGIMTDEALPSIARWGTQTTRVLEYNVTDAAKPVLLRDFEIEGTPLSTRRIGDKLLLVTNSWAWSQGVQPDGSVPTPVLRDGARGWTDVATTDIHYCPGFQNANYLCITTLNLGDPTRKAEIYTLLGAGSTMYVSSSSLYIASQTWNNWPIGILTESADVSVKAAPGTIDFASTESTDLLRFDITADKPALVAKGSVPGHLLNQFSMDESNGHLRVATTVGWASQTGAPTSSNHVTILDSAMRTTGSIDGIAPGEQIYSTRFMGSRGYMVTYRTTDPFYVLDLSDPAKPSILGELKIPGYSNYLHPLDDTHLIGFGKDSVEIESHWDPGTTWAYYQGMKIALFDVSDVAHPKQSAAVAIGDRGTDSELLWNHKALLSMPSKDLIAFPVNLCEIKPGSVSEEEKATAYGELIWQGMFVYRVTSEERFTELGRVSHVLPGQVWDSMRWISRGVVIGDFLYTISGSQIRSNRVDSMMAVDSLDIP